MSIAHYVPTLTFPDTPTGQRPARASHYGPGQALQTQHASMKRVNGVLEKIRKIAPVRMHGGHIATGAKRLALAA